MFATLLTACLLTPQAPASSMPSPGQTLETYPLHGILVPSQEDENMPMPPPLGSFLEHPDDEEAFQALAAVPSLEADLVVELLSTLHEKAFSDGLLRVDVQGETLLVAGDRAQTQAVGQSLRQLRAVLSRAITVEASLYRWPDRAAPPAVTPPDRLQASLDGAERIWRGTTRIRSGQVAELGSESWSDYLRSVDAEVAQEASIGRPDMGSVFEGVRLLVQPHSLVGSEDIVLFCQTAFGQRRETMRLRATGIAELPSLDVPVVDVNAGTFSGRIDSGGALIVTSTGNPAAGSRLALVVSARYTSPPPAVDLALRLFPISALTTASLQRARQHWSPYPPLLEGETLLYEDEPERGYGSVDPDLLQELVLSTRPAAFDNEEAQAFECGPFLGIRGDDDTMRAVETLLIGLQDRWLVNTELALRTDASPASPGLGPLDIHSSSDKGETWHGLTMPALQGRKHSFVRGIETTAIRTFWADIAQNASLYNPVVHSVFSGVRASLRSSPGDNGTLLDLQLELSHVPSPQRRPLEAKPGGDLYPAQFRLSRFQHRGEMTDGRAMDLGDGPQVGTGDGIWRTRQEVMLTLR